uniref:Uncharacterized protein n=1 Tax=Alexandrium andersonii TaxID=327968 RepID=A0A7S2FJZ5_9DINO|mmetsp:Transcript_26179/g.59547  ORF Transcript_26179/g.59547 Transcript_26179/m.59547 type:complete len:175 (+) Transcript_26179:117-641(+)
MARVVAMVACLACLSGSAHACSAEMQQMSDCSGTGTVTRTLAIPVVATAPGSACQDGAKDVYCDADLTYHHTQCSSSDCTTGCQQMRLGECQYNGQDNFKIVCAPSCAATTTPSPYNYGYPTPSPATTSTTTTSTARSGGSAMVSSAVRRLGGAASGLLPVAAAVLAIAARGAQ